MRRAYPPQWIVFLCFGTLLLTGCTLAQPLIRDTRTTVFAVASNQAKQYRLLPERSKALFVASEHYLKREPELELVIGVSNVLTGSITLDPLRPAEVLMSPIQVNLFALDTLNDELEEGLRYIYLQADLVPIATFTPLRYEGLPTTCTGEEELNFTIVGNMLIREITHEITFNVTAKIENEYLVGVATTKTRMTLFGVEPPSKVGISWVEDDVTIELKFVAAPES